MLKRLKKLRHNAVDFISIIVHPLFRLLGKKRIRILLYHRVCDLPEEAGFAFYVTPAKFSQQMEFLSRNGFNVMTLNELTDYRDGYNNLPLKSIVITFDDGYSDNYVNAFPILQRYNLKATFFVVTDYINSDSIFPWLNLDKGSLQHYQADKASWLPLTRQNILDMAAHGASFGAHTKTHCTLDSVEESEAIEELVDSRKCLEKILSTSVRCLSYPYGRVNNRIKNLAKEAGYRVAVAGVGSNTLRTDPFELRRITVQQQDSLAKFKRQIEGAYDWREYLQPVLKFIYYILYQGHEDK